MKIGITGATGQLGSIVVNKLKENAKNDIVALVRTPSKIENSDIEVRAFDYSKIEGQIEALNGIDVLLLISSSEVGQREEQHKNVIDAAKEAGVGRIVYTSLLHVDTSSLSLAIEHKATEAYIVKSGLNYTFLRNGWYTENYAMSIPVIVQSGSIIGSAGEGKIASATRDDFAEAAAIVLTSEGHNNKIYELAGDQSYTLTDFAAEISKQTGADITYINLPEAEYVSALEKVGVPNGFAQLLANSDIGASKGDLFDDSKSLSQLLGRPTTSLEEVVKRYI